MVVNGMLQKKLKDLLSKNENVINEKNIDEKIPTKLEDAKRLFEDYFHIPLNQDIILRTFTINGLNKQAMLIFIDTLVDKTMIENSILNPLLTNTDHGVAIENIITNTSLKKTKKVNDCIQEAGTGNSVLLIDGYDTAFTMSTAKYEARSIENPENEISLLGPKEGFSEKLETNINLIRKTCKSKDLIFESADISSRAHNRISLVYFKDLANEEILATIKSRLAQIDVGALETLSLIRQSIGDHPYSLFPTVLQSERPDRTIKYLDNGHIVILMENSPSALIMPSSFWSFLHGPDDNYLKFFFGYFTRVLRYLSLFLTLFASGFYVAVSSFHAEMIPPDLLLAIASTREKVPFPAFIEVFLMELSFELIREAGLRVPSPIGPTIGIVGAIILGQAATEANIVSPIVIIVVALSGLCSFVIGDIELNYTVRILRAFFIIAAGLFGIYGMAILFAMILIYLAAMNSFGIPYLAPITPKFKGAKDTVMRSILKKEKWRSGQLKPKDEIKRGTSNES